MMEPFPDLKSFSWFEIWRLAFLHPTIQTFTRISSDPKASLKWGVLWSGVTALIIWIASPLRTIYWGLVADQLGLEAGSYFLIIGTIVFPVLCVTALLINAVISHGLSRLFAGAGTIHQLVFCWGAMQLPFILFSVITYHILYFFYSIFRSFFHIETGYSAIGIILLVILSIAVAGILYLFYAQVVAFSAIESFSIGKGFGILFLIACILAIASVCFNFGFQSILIK